MFFQKELLESSDELLVFHWWVYYFHTYSLHEAPSGNFKGPDFSAE